jgi:ribose transport system permease protein
MEPEVKPVPTTGVALRPELAEYGVVIIVAALFVVLTLASDAFLSTTNLLNILDQQAAVGIMACAGTLVIIAGGFDLSVGAILGVAAVVSAQVTNDTTPALGFAAGAGAGLALGIFNAFAITVTRINTFIATLASSILFKGVALLMTGGGIVLAEDEGFRTLGRSEIFGAKVSVYVLAAVVLLSTWVLVRTTFGRYIYAVGGNEEAARLAGVRVDLVRAATFALSGLSAGVAGVIVASRTGSGQAESGLGIELVVIAAIVVGGTSIRGGEGAIWRTVMGVLLLAFIGNGFNLLNLEATYQLLFQGAIIMVAVAFDEFTKRRRSG